MTLMPDNDYRQHYLKAQLEGERLGGQAIRDLPDEPLQVRLASIVDGLRLVNEILARILGEPLVNDVAALHEKHQAERGALDLARECHAATQEADRRANLIGARLGRL